MKFVAEHFTAHHLFHAPHKWFLAFLLSPIHAAEIHYQQRYHLRFAHARKLFLFDMFLVFTVFFMATAWGFIYFYDPTVTKDVTMNLSASTDKIKNGEYITYSVDYKNKSTQMLSNGNVSFDLPTGFIFDKANPAEKYQASNRTFVLASLPPGASGKVSVGGWFYNNSDEKVLTAAHLSYKQEARDVLEQKVTQMFTTPRDSVLTTTITAPQEIVNGGSTEVKITVTNTGEKPLENISLALGLPPGNVAAKDGAVIEKNTWNVGKILAPQSTSVLSFTFTPNNLPKDTEATFSATPQIKIGSSTFVLSRATNHVWKVFSPDVQFSARFENTEALAPGKNVTANIVIKNNGNISLSDAVVTIPLANFVDSKRLTEINRGTLDKNGFHISSKQVASLLEIAPGKEIALPVIIPLKTVLEGTDVVVKLQPTFSSQLKNIGGGFTDRASTQEIKIGTKISLDASVRYYTIEGDQLGRGPLPPRVGKETKYAAIVRVSNSTSKVESVRFTADLPAHIQWTGKTSVSSGKEPIFDAASGRVSWSTLSLAPGETASIFMELSLTPEATQVGTTPIILKNISVSGTDTFIQEAVSARFRDLDTSLPNDAIGKIKGVTVKD